MLADVEHEPGALPLLSHALLETWNNRRGRTMTFGGYYEAGGVKGAIATRADTEFNDLYADEQAVARNIFVRLTELGEGSEDTRRRVSREELLGTGKDAETVTKVLTTLGYARLITVDQDEVEVAHEALIREWPALRGWLEDDREGLRIHRRLTETAEEWDGAGRKPGDLYRGTRLDQTLEWAAANEDSLNDLEREFLQESQAVIDAEERARKATEQKQIDDALEMERLATERADAADQARRRSQMAAIAVADSGGGACRLSGLCGMAILSGAGAALDGNRLRIAGRNSPEHRRGNDKGQGCGCQVGNRECGGCRC